MGIITDIKNWCRGYSAISNNGSRCLPGTIKYFCINRECPQYKEEVVVGMSSPSCPDCKRMAYAKCKECLYVHPSYMYNHIHCINCDVSNYETYGYD